MSNSVSLIIVNYNAGDFLAACVASALSQVDDLVVVDNASTDHSLAQLDAKFFGERKLRIVRNRENLGFAAACNIGVGTSAGSYLLFLNPDCVLEPDSVERLLHTLEVYPEAGMVGGLLVDPDGTEQGGGLYQRPGVLLCVHRAYLVLRIVGRACFSISTCTSSRCHLNR